MLSITKENFKEDLKELVDIENQKQKDWQRKRKKNSRFSDGNM